MNQSVLLQRLQSICYEYQDDPKYELAQLQLQKKLVQDWLEDWMLHAPKTVHPVSPIARDIRHFHKKLHQFLRRWDKALLNQQNLQQIVLEYPQHVIILIYGKVNSGKTSLCNWLMQQFNDQKQRCFYVERGEIIDCKGPFQASILNDEPRIQGVEIANRLVLIDAPGLYSNNLEQGDLAKAVIAHSDAILWLTPSHAPGQSDEIRDLTDLLQQAKPLLPIISCSDVFEEDIDPNTQEIYGVYRNKITQERQEQEQLLLKRIKSQFQPSIRPLSISLKMYEQTHNLEATGLSRLMDQLVELIEQASFYKLQKSQRNVKHFIEQRMLGDLKRLLNKAMPRLEKNWQQQQQDIQAHLQHVYVLIIDEMEQRISRLVQQYQQEENRDRVVNETQQYLNQILNQQLPHQLKRFIQDIPKQSIDLSVHDFPNYVEQYIEVPQQYGQAKEVVLSALVAVFTGLVTFNLIDDFIHKHELTVFDDFIHKHELTVFWDWFQEMIHWLFPVAVSAITHRWTTKQLKLGRLRIGMVKEKVNAQGQELNLALQHQVKQKLQATIKQLEQQILFDIAQYEQYYKKFMLVLDKIEREMCI